MVLQRVFFSTVIYYYSEMYRFGTVTTFLEVLYDIRNELYLE